MTSRKAFCVKRYTAEEAVANLPTLVQFSPPERIDMLVVAAGFEERVLAAPRALVRSGVSVGVATLVGWYGTNHDDNVNRYVELRPELEKLGAPIEKFDAEDPISTLTAISSAISRVPGAEEVCVAFDISGASSTLILSVLATLMDQNERRMRVLVLYATAASYDAPANYGMKEKLDLTHGAREQGVERVNHNALCTGLHHDHRPASVIALPSMYTDRLESCLSHLNVGPMTGSQDNLFWILPSTDAPDHKWRQSCTKSAVEALLAKYQGLDAESPPGGVLPPEHMATCDVSDYQGCIKLIISQIDRFQGRNISIVHMGTKLQGLGVALAVGARREVAVVTARPNRFDAKTYSDGIGDLHMVLFDDLGKAIEIISQIGSLAVESWGPVNA